MKSYLDLVKISSKIRKKHYRMTKFCIILAVALVTTIFGMADMEMRSQQLQVIKTNGNWHVLLTGIDEKEAKMIVARPEVKTSGWYRYLDEKNHYTVAGKAVSICGLEETVFQETFPTKVTEGRYPEAQNEVALTSNVKQSMGINLGDTITLEHPDTEAVQLTVVGYVQGSSRMLLKGEYAIILTSEGFTSAIPEGGYNDLYVVKLSKYCRMQRVIADIIKQFQLTDKQVLQNSYLLAALGQSSSSYIFQLYSIALVLFIIVLLAGVLMITSSLNSNVMQRTQFFGMMSCLGATKKQIMRFVRREGLHWCKIAIPIGIAIGVIVVWILCITLKVLAPGYFGEMPTFAISYISILFGIAVGLFTVLLAARAPARKAASVSPMAAVSGNAYSIQPLRTAARTGFLKVDIALGIHHAISSKKNFLLMMGSFALSIVLFLGFSTAVDFMHHAVKPLRPWTPDLSIVSSDNSCSIDHSLLRQLQENPKIKKAYGRMFAYDLPVKASGQDKVINLISYESHQFHWAKDTLINGSLDEVERKVNTALVVYHSENAIRVGDTLTLDIGGDQKELTIAGLLSTSPFSNEAGVETVICSEATFRQLTGEDKYTILDIQLTKSATEEDVDAIHQLAGTELKFSDRRLSNSEARGSFYAFALFIYGFLVIIALITIFNIVNSIAMSVSARIRQYGAMRAIGMSSKQLVNMVMAEAVTYAVSGSIVGCIIGLPLHKSGFEQSITSRWGDPWYIPWSMIGIIVAIVFISSVLAVRNPAKRIHNMSIVDTISAQ